MILAHGIGTAADLPLPLDLVLQAGAAAVLVSFLGVAVMRRRPGAGGPAVPASSLVDTPWLRGSLRAVALVVAGSVVVTAFWGPPAPDNPAPYALYAWLWVGLVPASLLLGPVWSVVNPLRTLHAALVRLGLPPEGLRPGPADDLWPAAGTLLAFVWLELVAPHRDTPAVVGTFLLAYAAVQLGGAVWRGPGWFARGDAFEVYSTLIGQLAPFTRRGGRPALRNPLPALAAAPSTPGLAAFVAVWWGSTVVDGVSSSTVWAAVVQRTGAPVLLGSVLLVAVCVAVAASIVVVARAGDVAPTLVPIATGYTVAHYFSLLVIEGGRSFTLLVASGSAPWRPAPVVVATVQVGAVLLGHVAGVVAAHDRVLAGTAHPTLGERIADELPLVLVMVGYTLVGLTLLFST